MTIRIRPGLLDDLASYTVMMQETYEAAYVDESIGLTKACFSPEVFASGDTQAYLRSKLISTAAQQSWVAVDEGEIVGAVAVETKGSECEMTGFYVLPRYQGRGIGTMLWQKVLEFAGSRAIVLDIYTHNKKTIQLYEHWGFREDTARPHFYRHWPEWPESLQAESMYMRREPSVAKEKQPL